MNLLTKIRLYRMAITISILAGFFFAVIIVYGLTMMVNAERWAKHTGDVLAHLAETQRAITAAEQGGRAALTNPAITPLLEGLRTAAAQDVETLVALTTDNAEQQNNLATVKLTLEARWAAQDEQRENMVVVDHSLNFPVDITIRAQQTAKDLELAIASVRETEVRVLLSRQEERTGRSFQLTYMVIFLFLVALVSVVIAMRDVLIELRVQKAMRDQLESKLVHASRGGKHLVLTETEVVDLIHLIDTRPSTLTSHG